MKTETTLKIQEVLNGSAEVAFWLLASSILWVSLAGNMKERELFLVYSPIFILVYFIIGMYKNHLESRANIKIRKYEWLRGGTGFIWISFLSIALIVAIRIIPYWLRMIIFCNAAAYLILWRYNYYILKKIAIELNNGKKGKCTLLLLEDLQEKPKDTAAFLKEVDTFCNNNYKEWCYIEYDNPAIIKADGLMQKITLSFYYDSFGGIIYSLEIQDL